MAKKNPMLHLWKGLSQRFSNWWSRPFLFFLGLPALSILLKVYGSLKQSRVEVNSKSSEFGSEKGLTPGLLRRIGESETK